MRTEGFKRGVAFILLVFALVFSMMLVVPLASPGNLIFDPGGTTIEVAQGGTFVIRHKLEWNEPKNGAYAVTIAWDCYDNEPSENFTFLGASAYFTTGPHAGQSILAVVKLGSAPIGTNTRYGLSVKCPPDQKDPRNGEFNVDIILSASGVDGVPHVPSDHVIPFQLGGIIIVEDTLTYWNRDPVTIRVLSTIGLLPHDPIYIYGNDNFIPANGVTSGSGTENDPYIIEGWDISAENANGIEIRNTTAYFVVRNCVVENGWGTFPNYYDGIYLDNVVNGRIENNTCDTNYYGIRLSSSSNNTLTNNTCENNNDDGIYLSSSSNYNTLENNTCKNNEGIGIYLSGYSKYNTLDNNTCENNDWHGISVGSSNNNLISNNTCENNYMDGILLQFSSNNTLTNNTCENNYSGIWLVFSDNNLISNNLVNNNVNGISLVYSDNNLVTNNFVKNNPNGIGLIYSHNNILENNTCENNEGIGIYLDYSSYNTLSNNTCENNDYGIYLYYNSEHNSIYHNNFINNMNQAYDNGSNYWDNGYPSGGNYWSDYTGVDENRGENQDIPGSDGIGDTPYYIPGDNNRDHYPLMSPWSTPDYVYLTWDSPDTAHTINISWRTDENYVGEVRYDTEARGGEPDAYSGSVEGTGGVTTSKFNGYIHHVELTGLEPYTTYHFICGNPSHGWSEELSFRTAPVEKIDIRFVAGGDSRSDPRPGYPHPDWPEARDGVTQLMASYDPDFVIFSGDFLWNGETQEGGVDTWDNWFGSWYRYARAEDGRLIPIVPAIGNHEIVYPQPSDYDPETDASNYYMLFNLPENEQWYSLNWGPDLHIVVLDSEIRYTGGESWNNQLEWLGQDLLVHWDDLWKIATAHRPAFSSGHYSGDANIQRDWIPEFDLQHLDLYFSGHDHNYTRTHPINYSISTENYQPSPENGTIYMVSAGWGAPLYSGSPRWWTAYGPDPRYHFTLVDVFENSTLYFQAIDLDGTVFDEFSIYKDFVSILPGEVIVGGKDTAYNTDLEGPSPLKSYASSPPLMVAAKVGSGAVVATGTVSTCRDTRWNAGINPDPYFDVLLDKAFQWMVPGATKVLWFEGYGVYNTIDKPEVQCQQLENALEAKGYTLTGDATTPITSGLLSGYDILVIPQMQLGESGTGGNPDQLPDSDVQAIVDFVNGGGGLLIMESSDYLGLNYSKVHNKILKALGASFYFQHDQVQDDTNNWGGANYQPIADVDTTTEIGSAYQSETGKDEIGLYSICSLRIEVDYEVSVRVSPTIKVGGAGEELTYEATITNIGTQSDDFTLTINDELGWPVSLSQNSVSLGPGESEVVEASVTVPTGLTEKMINWITLTASGVSEDDARFRAINIFPLEEPPYPIVRPDVVRFLGPGLPTLLVDPPAVPIITAVESGFSVDLTPREPEPILYGKGEFAPVSAAELIDNGRVIALSNSILRDAYYDRPELANDEVMSMIVRWMLDWADPRGHSLLYWVTEGSYHLPPGTGAPIVTKYIEVTLKEGFGMEVGTQVGGEITPELISDYDIVHLNEILRPLSHQEIQAVVDYVNGGGGLIIGCQADYGGYGRPQYPNELLEVLGSQIRFQDDELYDEDSWVVDGPWYPQVYLLDPRGANTEFDVWSPEHDFAIYMPTASMTLESAPALFPLMITNTGTKGSTYSIEVEEITALGWDVEIKPATIDVGSGESAEIFMIVTVPDIAVGRERITLRATVTDDVQTFLTKSKAFAVLGEDGRAPPSEAKFTVGQSVYHDDWGNVTIEAFGWDGSAWAYVVETAEGELKLAAEAELAEIPPVIEWDTFITVTFSGGGDDAIFGVRPDATDNFDGAYDIPEPPAPPEPPHVRAYFYYPGQTPDELHCSYLAPENLMEWPLRIEYADNIEDITLMWSVENISSEYPVLLYRGGDLVADMRAEENYTFEASTGSYDFRIVVGELLPFTLELAQGWNMISFPVLPENSSPDAVFGSYYVLYRWDAEDKRYVLHADSGSFIEPDPDVEAGVGYWAYVLEDENVDLLGVPVDQLTLSLRQDWSLIGPPYGGSSIADPADDPDNSVLPYAFTWNSREKSYSMTQLLEAGKGYWTYALRDCTLTLLPRRLEPAAIKIGFPISTVIEEPWIGVIYTALVRAENELGVTLDWSDDIGYADLPAVIREWATDYDIVITDSFGCEEAARIAAMDFPDTQFVFGSGLGPVEPNVAVFDDWIHEPAYICGMIAGKLTETNIIGVVGGVPVPEVNRLINAFKAGALETNPDVKMKVVFLGEWFNPPVAKEKALAQIEAGADVMYAERYGVHEAALEKLATEDKVIPLFGNLLDQYELAPELVVTGPVWDMWPTVKYVIETYIMRDGEPFSMDLAEWTMARKGGAELAPWHNWETRLDSRIVAKMQAEDIISMVETRWAKILDGTFRVYIDESIPVSD